MSLSLTPLGEHLGVEVGGVDLSRGLADDEAEEILAAFYRHKVMVIPDQTLEVAQLTAFARRFGSLRPHILSQFHHADSHEVSVLSNRPESGMARSTPRPAGAYWHSDESYRAVPPAATMLYAIEVPSDGGDTLYVDMALAWRTLPAAMRRRLEGCEAEHHIMSGRDNDQAKVTLTPEQAARTPAVVHPVARTHPVTGETVLFVNPGFTKRILGLPEAESDALLDELFAHATRPEVQYRHRWRAGELVAWDDAATLHSATGGYSQPRTLLRMMVGDAARESLT